MKNPRARATTRWAAPLLAALVALPCAGVAEVVTALPAAAAAQVLTPVVPAATQQQQILDGLNRERAKVGAPAVTLDPTLEVVAQDWADVLAQGDGMKHNPNLGTLLSDFPRWGEIVATADMGNPDTRGLENGDLAVTTWMGSDPHRAVLQDATYNTVGIGLVYTTLVSGGRTVWRSYWVADFGSPRRTPQVTASTDGSRSYAGVPVRGAILQSYTATGANAGSLGLPLSREIGPLRAGGYAQELRRRVDLLEPRRPARRSSAARCASAGPRWASRTPGWATRRVRSSRSATASRSGSRAGSSTGRPPRVPRPSGARCSTPTGRAGWENGFLGFPTSTATGLPGGSYAHFQGGSLYSSGAGTHAVAGAVRSAWAAQGWEAGTLGYPASDRFGGLVAGGCGPALHRRVGLLQPRLGHAHRPARRPRRLGRARRETGALGYPVSEPRAVTGGVQQDFQGGRVTVATGKTAVALHSVARGRARCRSPDARSPARNGGGARRFDHGPCRVGAHPSIPARSGRVPGAAAGPLTLLALLGALSSVLRRRCTEHLFGPTSTRSPRSSTTRRSPQVARRWEAPPVTRRPTAACPWAHREQHRPRVLRLHRRGQRRAEPQRYEGGPGLRREDPRDRGVPRVPDTGSVVFRASRPNRVPSAWAVAPVST